MADSYTTAAALREEILSSASGARGFIAGLFDEGTFLETGTYIRNAGDDRNFEGVITGCGAVNGPPCFRVYTGLFKRQRRVHAGGRRKDNRAIPQGDKGGGSCRRGV